MISGQEHLTKASSIGSLAHTTKEEDTAAQNSSLPRHVISEQKKHSSGSIIPDRDFELKGRFKVTADPYPKEFTNCSFTPFSGCSSSPSSISTTSASILPAVQSILQQNAMQREEILRLIKYVDQTSGSLETSVDEPLRRLPATPRERELETQLIHLHQSIGSITELVKKQKQKSAQLENQLNALTQRNG